MAVAVAAYEDEVVGGWGDARNQFRAALIEVGQPGESNPFGADPALAASIGHPDDGRYRGSAPTLPEADLPTRPVTAGGVVS